MDTWQIARRLLRATAAVAVVLACASAGTAQTTAESEVKAAVERFLKAAGERDVDQLATMFAPGASIASAGLRNGRWVTTSQSAEAWLASQRSSPGGATYEEPVSHYTVHVDDGQLAFVRAEATLVRDGRARSRNVDYFTLLRNSNGEWTFVNGSYTAKPLEQ